MHLVVTTAIFGGYDTIRPGGYFAPGIPYILFTDDPRMEFEGWTTRVVEDFADLPPVRRARAVKILMHRMLPQAEYTIWHGANVVLLKHPLEVLEEWLGQHQLAAFRHPHRDCIYQEAEVCKALRKGRADQIDRQVAAYRAQGYPEHNGLAAAWFLIRKHGTWVDQFDERWWHEVQTYSARDQLSFNYALWRMERTYQPIPGDLLAHPDLQYYQHRPFRG